jgi:hypothetical protein
VGMSTSSRPMRICMLGAECMICPLIAGFTPLALLPDSCAGVAWLVGMTPPGVGVPLVGRTCARAKQETNAAMTTPDNRDHFKGCPPLSHPVLLSR